MKGSIAFAGFVMLSACSFGQVTGLVSIPVADNIGFREVEFGYSLSGTDHSISKQYGHGASLLVGVHDRFEIAGSSDFLGGQAWGMKFVPYRSPDEKFVIGLGLQNINGGQSDLFAMGRYNLDAVNIHFGWTRDSDHRGLLGIDYAYDRWTFAADYSSNPDGATWLGVFYDLGQGLTANVSFGRPHTRADGDMHAFGLTYGIRF
ncbi:hypothetical protein C0431_02850 [bacterium]|nr:hypothetical protein [bacterium]